MRRKVEVMGLFERYLSLWVAQAIVAALATVVGVLVEVPVMLSLVHISSRTRHLFSTSA